MLAMADGRSSAVIETDAAEVAGVNSRAELAGVERAWQDKRRAQAMAEGALKRSHADWAVAITGIAGPGGGSPDKPVGMVCFGWAGPDGVVATDSRCFAGSREQVRAQSVAHALRGVLQCAAILSA